MYRISGRDHRNDPAAGAHGAIGVAGGVLFRAVIGPVASVVDQSFPVWAHDFRLEQPPCHTAQGEIYGHTVHRDSVWRIHPVWCAPFCDWHPSGGVRMHPNFYLDAPELTSVCRQQTTQIVQLIQGFIGDRNPSLFAAGFMFNADTHP